MLDTSIIDQISDRINDLLMAEKNTISEYKERIKSAELALEKASEDYTEAFNACDEKAYKKASDAQRSAKDIIEMYSIKLEKQLPAPLMSEEEYSDTINKICDELDSINSQATYHIESLIDEMEKYIQITNSIVNEGNDLLHDLQHKIMKDDATMLTAGGQRIHIEMNEKKYTGVNLLSVVNRCKKLFEHATSTYPQKG